MMTCAAAVPRRQFPCDATLIHPPVILQVLKQLSNRYRTRYCTVLRSGAITVHCISVVGYRTSLTFIPVLKPFIACVDRIVPKVLASINVYQSSKYFGAGNWKRI